MKSVKPEPLAQLQLHCGKPNSVDMITICANDIEYKDTKHTLDTCPYTDRNIIIQDRSSLL